MEEKALDFLNRFRTIHHPDRRDRSRCLRPGEVEIADGWRITVVSENPAVGRAADDLADYFAVSMGIAVAAADGETPAGAGEIRIEESAELPANDHTPPEVRSVASAVTSENACAG